MSKQPQWQIDMEEAQAKRALKRMYPDLGKIVKYDGEYGLVVFREDFGIDPFGPGDDICVRWDTKEKYDFEQYGYFEYEFIDSYEFKHINADGTQKE